MSSCGDTHVAAADEGRPIPADAAQASCSEATPAGQCRTATVSCSGGAKLDSIIDCCSGVAGDALGWAAEFAEPGATGAAGSAAAATTCSAKGGMDGVAVAVADVEDVGVEEGLP